jgi:SmpA / OmlA family
MRRHRQRWALLVVALVLVAPIPAVALWPSPQSRVTLENLRRIQIGMSRDDVESILGPPGDRRTGQGETADSGRWSYWRTGPEYTHLLLGSIGDSGGRQPDAEEIRNPDAEEIRNDETSNWTADPVVDLCPWTWSRDEIPGLGQPEDRRWATWASDSFVIRLAVDGSKGVQVIHGAQRRSIGNPVLKLVWHAKRLWHRLFPDD